VALGVGLTCLGLGGWAWAHTLTVDGSAAEWLSGRSAETDNLGLIARDSTGQGEYIWRDRAGDERTDFYSPDTQVDMTRVHITGASCAGTGGVAFLVRFLGGADSNIQVQIAIDLDGVSSSGAQWFVGFADTTVDSRAYWERLVQTRFTSGRAPAVWQGDYSLVGTGSAALGTDGMEIFVPWSLLGLAAPPSSPLRFTIAAFRAGANDDTADVTDSDALDVVTHYGDPGLMANTWTEVSDGAVNYFASVYFTPAGEAYAPLLVDRFMANNGTTFREHIVVRNVGPGALDLASFKVGDEETPDAGEGMYTFPAGAVLQAGRTFTIAERGTDYETYFQIPPDAEFNSTSAGIPDLPKYVAWAMGVCALANSGDQILVLDGSDTILDVVAYGTAGYAGITARAAPAANEMVVRDPCASDTDDCVVDFVSGGTPGYPFALTTVVRTSNQCVRLEWRDIGASFVVDGCFGLTTGGWSAVTNTSWPINGGTWTSVDPVTNPRAFYRVRRN
jgi:hypothetical protein